MNIFFADNGEKFENNFLLTKPEFIRLDDERLVSVDVLVVDGVAGLERFRNRRINTCFCPSARFYDVINSMYVKSAVSCGMRERDSVTFSSIGEDNAMVCIKRKVSFLDRVFEPCEFRVSFDRKRGLYTNLALGTLGYLVNNYGD